MSLFFYHFLSPSFPPSLFLIRLHSLLSPAISPSPRSLPLSLSLSLPLTHSISHTISHTLFSHSDRRDERPRGRVGGRRTDYGVIVTHLPKSCSWQVNLSVLTGPYILEFYANSHMSMYSRISASIIVA